jgi:hypothetical protein
VSDDDLVRRDKVEAILRRRVDGCYGDCTTQCLSCAAKEDIEEIRALPAVPPAAAERLARAYVAHADSVARGMVALRDGSYARAERELDEAEAAYRAAPLAAEPSPRCPTPFCWDGTSPGPSSAVLCGRADCQAKSLAPAAEPAPKEWPDPVAAFAAVREAVPDAFAEPAPRTTTTGAIVSALAQMGLAQLAEPAAQPFPRASWVCAICDGGPANDCACSCPDGGKRAASAPEPSDRPE